MFALLHALCKQILFLFRKLRALAHKQSIFLLLHVFFDFLFAKNNVLLHPSIYEMNQAVGVFFRKLPIVRNDDYKLILRELFQRFDNLLTRCRIERARRFVRHDDAGLFYKRTGNGYPLSLPARKLAGIAGFEFLDFHVFKELFKRRLVRLYSLQFHCHFDIFLNGKFGKKIVFLENESDKGIAVVVVFRGRKGGELFILHQNFPFVYPV